MDRKRLPDLRLDMVRGARVPRNCSLPDEGRYADIAREMLDANDWVTPRLNGLKYLEKPPLQYWATASAFAVLGVDEWTARLWPAYTGFSGSCSRRSRISPLRPARRGSDRTDGRRLLGYFSAGSS